MSSLETLYPALDRFFDSRSQMAHAGCMSRDHLWRCLTGQREFTRAQKKAIAANIAVRLMNQKSFDYADLERAVNAWKGNFDEVYRKKV